MVPLKLASWNWKEGRREGRKGGRKEGREEGRKGGREGGREKGRHLKEYKGRKEGRKEGLLGVTILQHTSFLTKEAVKAHVGTGRNR